MNQNLLLGAYVAAGGAIGSLARFGVGLALPERGGVIPLATLLVNVTGSLLIGLLAPTIAARADARAFLMVGLCGGYTTFSAFSLETVRLMQSGRLGTAMLYTAASVALCLGATWLGIMLGRGLGA
jgi:CrcB protein